MAQQFRKLPPKNVIKPFELLSIAFVKIFLPVVVSSKRVKLSSTDIKPNDKYVIVSNHQGAMDPAYICAGLNFNIHRKLAPYRFFVANRFFEYPFSRFLLLLLGCFPAKRSNYYPYGLRIAERFVEDDQTVVIFPEGRVSRTDRYHKPKRGVEALAKLTDVKLIPVRVRWDRNKGLTRSYSIAVGKPFDGSLLSADQIMDVVYSLKFE